MNCVIREENQNVLRANRKLLIQKQTDVEFKGRGFEQCEDPLLSHVAEIQTEKLSGLDVFLCLSWLDDRIQESLM